MATEGQTESKEAKKVDNGKAIAKKVDPGIEVANALKDLGFGDMSEAPLEQIKSGGIQKWLNLKAFQADPNAPQNKAVAATGKMFAGILIGRQEIEVDDDEAGELNADGHKVRFFYNLRLVTPAPVTFKDDSGASQEGEAKPGDIIAVGERHTLKDMRALSEDGGTYCIVIKPHSRISIGRGQTMWTFDMWKKTLRPPMKISADVKLPRTPF